MAGNPNPNPNFNPNPNPSPNPDQVAFGLYLIWLSVQRAAPPLPAAGPLPITDAHAAHAAQAP